MVDQMVDQDEVKNEYEIAFLLKEEADFKDLLALLRQSEAVVTFEGPVKKIALAYEIAKQSAAYFGWLRFTAPTHRICEIEHALILHHTVLRSLIVKFTPGLVSVPRGTMTPSTATPAITPTLAPIIEQTAGSHGLPLSNEDLEKKIEEILR